MIEAVERRREELEALASTDLPAAEIAEALLDVNDAEANS